MGLIKTMPIGQDKTRVGIITYNSDVSKHTTSNTTLHCGPI